MDASAGELRDFVAQRGKRRVVAVALSALIAAGVGTLLSSWWPNSCETFAQRVCDNQGQSDHCHALRALAQGSLEADLCAEADETFDAIEGLDTAQVERFVGMSGATVAQWAELRMVLKYRVSQLVMRGHWPRQALQSQERFERALSAELP